MDLLTYLHISVKLQQFLIYSFQISADKHTHTDRCW